MALLKIRQLVKQFDQNIIVDQIDLDIEQGEFLSILGPSGCGKSTLLRLIAGFEEVDAGTISLAGQDVTYSPPYARPTNMMFQSYALFPHMTVENNIAFGLQQDKLPKTEIAARTREMLSLVKMEEFAKRKPDQLSGGQKQRVALARALAKHPKLLLLDEPLTALDKNLREHMRTELVNIQRKVGTTFIMVTHDQEEAMSMSSRVALMNQGKLVQIDRPEMLYNAPVNRFTAEFLGNINVIQGVVLEKNGQLYKIKINGFEQTLDVECKLQYDVGNKVSIVVRPEKTKIHDVPVQNDSIVLQGELSNIVYLGDSSVYDVLLSGNVKVQVQKANTDASWQNSLRKGQPVYVSWHPQSSLLFKDE